MLFDDSDSLVLMILFGGAALVFLGPLLVHVGSKIIKKIRD